MLNPLSNYYQPKKPIFVYLDTDTEIQALATELKKENKAIFITQGREEIKTAWESKKYPYIVWAYRTNQEERWVVIVLDTQKEKATIHTSTQSEPAKKEQEEVNGFLVLLKGLKDKTPKLDIDTKTRTAQESGFVAILYVLKILKRIAINGNISTIDASGFDDKESDGKTKIQKVEEKYKQLLTEIANIPSLDKLQTDLKTPTPNKTVEQIKGDVEKLLKDTQIKWNSYSTDNTLTNINVRMFQDFKIMAQEILPFIEKALKSKGELADYQLLDKEWGKNRTEYDINRDYLNAWYTLRIYLKEWEILSKNALLSPISTISEEEKKKLMGYEILKVEKEQLTEENKILKKEKKKLELEQTISQKPQPRNKLVDRIRQKITQGYNSPEHLWGSNLKIMKSFLTWEYVGTDEQKEAVKTLRTEINNCIGYLEKVQTQTNY